MAKRKKRAVAPKTTASKRRKARTGAKSARTAAKRATAKTRAKKTAKRASVTPKAKKAPKRPAVKARAKKQATKPRTKRATAKRAVQRPTEPSRRLPEAGDETVTVDIVDIVEEPVPGVVVVTEFESVRTTRPEAPTPKPEGEEGSRFPPRQDDQD